MHPTAGRLLRATEELLVERGEARTSLRDITDRAQANVAAVSYHFRSKDALIEETFRLALEEVTERRRRQLAALAPDAGLRDVVRTWLAPALDPAAQEPRESTLWALISRGVREEAPGLLAVAGRTQAVVDDELVTLLAGHLPHLSDQELRVRHAATLAALSALTASQARGVTTGDDVPGPGTDRSGASPAGGSASLDSELLLDWVVGGLSGPSSRTPSGHELPNGAVDTVR